MCCKFGSVFVLTPSPMMGAIFAQAIFCSVSSESYLQFVYFYSVTIHISQMKFFFFVLSLVTPVQNVADNQINFDCKCLSSAGE